MAPCFVPFFLPHNLTQDDENCCETKMNNLRVLGHFRLKKARKALHHSGWRNRRQLITRRSLVQVQPPQPQKHRFPAEKRCFFLLFCNFLGRPHFLDTGVTQTVTQTGQKIGPEAVFSPPGLRPFWRDFLPFTARLLGPFPCFCRLLLGRRGDVGVGVQCKPGAEVSQHSGHRLDIYPVLEGQRCECMP